MDIKITEKVGRYIKDNEVKTNDLKLANRIKTILEKINTYEGASSEEIKYFLAGLKRMDVSSFDIMYVALDELLSLNKEEIEKDLSNLDEKLGFNILKPEEVIVIKESGKETVFREHEFKLEDIMEFVKQINSKIYYYSTHAVTNLNGNIEEADYRLLLDNIRNNDKETITTLTKEYNEWLEKIPTSSAFYKVVENEKERIIPKVIDQIKKQLSKIASANNRLYDIYKRETVNKAVVNKLRKDIFSPINRGGHFND